MLFCASGIGVVEIQIFPDLAQAEAELLAAQLRSEQEIEGILSEAMNKPVTSELIIALPREGFDVAMKLLVQHSDMTQVLEQSKRAAKRKKEVANTKNNFSPAGPSDTYCKFCGRDTAFCMAEPCKDSARTRRPSDKANGSPQPVVEALGHSDPQEVTGD